MEANMVTTPNKQEQDTTLMKTIIINDKFVDVSTERNGKLYKEILTEGAAGVGGTKPMDGCQVFVHYVGSLPNGTVFDRSVTKDAPFSFVVGQGGSVIRGWDQGIPSMNKGERAKLYVHPDYGYGANGLAGKIPGNSALIFEVELIDFKPEDLTTSKSGALLRHKIRTGKSKYLYPKDGSSVTVNLEGVFEGRKFDERTVTFVLGEGVALNIPRGVEKALFKFSENEKSLLTIGPKYAFGPAGSKEFNIPPNATVQYSVELESFERAREGRQMVGPERIQAAQKAKDMGTVYFKQESYYLAARQYKNIVTLLKTYTFEGEPEELRKPLLLASYLNQAICHLKLGEPVVAKRHAEEAIEADPNNPKAYYRRGLANVGMEEAEEAKKDFMKVVELEPDNKAARQQIAACDKLIKQHKERAKQVYSRMFDKFAKVDTAKEQAE